MDLKSYPLEPAEGSVPTPGISRVQGVIKLPKGAKIKHVGAAPPAGEMFVYCEVSPVKAPIEEIDIVVLGVGDTIPIGYEYLGYILAVPILFIYKRRADGIILGS